ncbi:STAS domain-containing protein [Kineococcus aurantiacus]|uniref:Anti-anti-sigma factor n=1 Tax=Kineococcus aurantiacus TaxID=37633 RepID=A0A7Y9ARM2_9ACTN|nr:anti-anti-sigma factor [Kineococcus aurantiacus]
MSRSADLPAGAGNGRAERDEQAPVQVQVDAGRITVRLHGDVDTAVEHELRAAIEDAVDLAGTTGTAETAVVVDVHQVPFMDSTGVAFLARLALRLAPRRVVVAGAGRQVRFVLDLTQVDQVVDLLDDPEDHGAHEDLAGT